MFEKLDQCPLCNSGHFHNHLICKDYSVSKQEFALVKCDECNFVFTNPRPAEEHLHSFYESSDYISHTNKTSNPINFVYKIVRSFTIRQKLSLINSLQEKGKILDVGCGTGHFLTACKNSDWETYGVEPSEQAMNQIVKKLNNVYASLSEINSDKFDVITLWHVLEHVPDINEYLEQIKVRLSKTGTLIVAVPNIESFDQNIYKEKWAAYDVPRHLYHFTQSTMRQLMKKHKFKVKKILPMKFDSFYVSLLSEKNLNGGNIIRAILNGLKSNRYAKNHKNNYSSLIYIISK